jgi:Peptidase family M48
VQPPAEQPTDEEFLDRFYQNFEDPEWIRLTEQMVPHMIDVVRRAYESLYPGEPPTAEEIETAARESASPGMRAGLVAAFRDIAAIFLKEDAAAVSDIPVGITPCRTFNALTVVSPRGHPVIIMDHGIAIALGAMIVLYRGFENFSHDPTNSRVGEQAGLARSLVDLAKFCATGDLGLLRRALDECNEEPEPALLAICEQVVLLHEYGHALLGHLDDPSVLVGALAMSDSVSTTALQAYDFARSQEFEADAFAFRKMCEAGLRPSDVALIFGWILHFQNFCERFAEEVVDSDLRTHPFPAERWAAIKDLAEVNQSPTAPAFRVDRVFDAIWQMAGPPIDSPPTPELEPIVLGPGLHFIYPFLYQVAGTTNAAIALLRETCPQCRGDVEIQADLLEDVPLRPGAHHYPADDQLECPICGRTLSLGDRRGQVEADTGRRVVGFRYSSPEWPNAAP